MAKDPRDLCGGKGDAFAKGVHRIDQPFGMGGAQGGQGGFGQIIVGAAREFGRYRMGPQKGGPDSHIPRPAQTAGDTKQAKLCFHIQAIA